MWHSRPGKILKVADFASDALALSLLSRKNVALALSAPGFQNNNQCNVMFLIMLRVHLLGTDANGLSRNDRIAMKIAALIWIDSITGIHFITKRNLALEVIGMIFHIADSVCQFPRYATEEGCEHTFGFWRSSIKEFTANDTIYLTAATERYISSSLESGLSTGRVGDTKGYLGMFPDYIQSIKKQVDARQIAIAAKNAALVVQGEGSPKRRRGDDDCGVTVTAGLSRVTQLFPFIQQVWNQVVSDVEKLLDLWEVPISARSKFCIKIKSSNELRDLLTSLLPNSVPPIQSKPPCPQTAEICDCGHNCIDSNCVQPRNISPAEERAEQERLFDRIAANFSQTASELDEEASADLDIFLSDLLNQIEEPSTPETTEPVIITPSQDLSTGSKFSDLLKMVGCPNHLSNVERREFVCQKALDLLASIEGEHGTKEVATVPQQHGTIKSRFWNQSAPEYKPSGANDTIGRGSRFRVGTALYVVFGVFKVSYQKWRYEPEVLKTDNAYIHAMKVVQHGYGNAYMDIPSTSTPALERKNGFLLIKVKEVTCWD
ncbi:hypothetical protein BCR33DRAFT_21066 [Rhizoclosmatium globosum]|uniref:Uncharacterized protein n=1 Tax=Rhizoclosmatium globosum TaxID=329046 RepID=A0A1Y2AYS3_9FUNG|nr:hypothetical protein BCR33DRAFT_21066 [Rhizoclosmatium globosum]|eukprot:ORY27729.1 hypothetical protein BCR33DRAFT_21066 [Rhizoclosmatium globosum]